VSDSSDLLNGLLPFPVSFTSLALILFAIIAGFAFLRGVLRLMFAMLALAIGTVAAFYTYQNAPLFFTAPRTILIVSIVAGLVSFLAARHLILNILLRPLLGKHRGAIGGIGALLSLIPTAFLIWVLASGFRLTGTVMEMEQFGENVTADEGGQIHEGWIAQWRRAMDNDGLARLLAKIDPFLQQGKAAVVGLLISERDVSATDEIAGADENMAEILNTPGMRELRSDPTIRKLIKEGNYVSLLQHPKVREAARESGFSEKLKSIDIAASVEKALYSSESKDQPKVRKRIPTRLWRNKEE
jgi:hypothetical protein